MILDAWVLCTGTTQWDGMGREEGGGFRMGNTCMPVADSFQYMAEPIQYSKVKKKKKEPQRLICPLYYISICAGRYCSSKPLRYQAGEELLS